jgi:hypothetical protein
VKLASYQSTPLAMPWSFYIFVRPEAHAIEMDLWLFFDPAPNGADQ